MVGCGSVLQIVDPSTSRILHDIRISGQIVRVIPLKGDICFGEKLQKFSCPIIIATATGRVAIVALEEVSCIEL